ncbi:MAG: hypothetical protein CENE_02333 [Candidatus Celerinatantimonas neptuna]|nr:MAG: hypothetical protein CENE_02333 [Candidatus Celerinatantimonas neptuna]
MLELSQAQKESDWQRASVMLSQTVEWLNHQGQPLWTRKQVSLPELQQCYPQGSLYFAKHDQQVVGVLFLSESDSDYWPEYQQSDSLFIHKLTVARDYAGQHIGEAILQCVKQFARKSGKTWLRLDCHANRPKLNAFYEKSGFQLVDRKVVHSLEVSRYKLCV